LDLSSKLEQIEVDFDKVLNGEDIDETLWAGHTVGFTCLGLYTGAKPKEEWKKIEIDYNVAVAKLLLAGGTERYHYLSGKGVVEEGKSTMIFSQIKGKAEAEMRDLGFSNFAALRPGLIYGRAEERKQYIFESAMNSFHSVFGSVGGCTCADIAKAFVWISLMDNPPQIVENQQIKDLAKDYDI